MVITGFELGPKYWEYQLDNVWIDLPIKIPNSANEKPLLIISTAIAFSSNEDFGFKIFL